jgi:hypothetical protein
MKRRGVRMSKKERDLPKPGKTPFSRKRPQNEGQDDLLMADQMAMAAAEGKLNEYLDKEIPEGEYAKKLAMMMMGMTGILPNEGALPADEEAAHTPVEATETGQAQEGEAAAPVPEDVVKAVQAGDVEKLKELLAREKQKRTPGSVEESGEVPNLGQCQPAPSMIEKDMLDLMIKVAFDNKVSVDWLMARALKLYLEEYQKTGRL